ncbi:Fpg/Nei family DNA glycosylase [Nocardioides sp. ChNu-153]|uniref:DNA-formamidopyrimidine glycosylase family protein n=1 Tax=unclassified Nocardioides TaxID=2615069 RepID=UPI002404E0C7|nr:MULTISPECIES: DNA-formamidopyrimidine glycosylase family protein [unclassified Nocardioides]MDF9717585.1 Fpg/Nei family DNA glycosylase [Nocardioides sp. ChNu-99]MDN7121716.1 Fpg/Nei family DNA glycosylase [Nocardioides sp. ChNu-153]
MPEGDTVYRAARGLDRALAGRVLDVVDLRVPRLATVDLAGSRHVATVPRGKHLLTRLEHDTGEWTLHTHLKMEGVWHTYAAGQRWRRPAHEARVVLRSGDVSAVGFALGVVDLVLTAHEDEVVGHLGPDLLGPDWDADEATRRLLADAGRPVVEALLEQRSLAGVGNVFANELCFVAGVHPATPVGAVARPERLVQRAHQMLVLNKDRAVRCTTGDTRPGRELWVYGRARKPCRRCGTPVVRQLRTDDEHPDRGERTTYWCPHCQPEQ